MHGIRVLALAALGAQLCACAGLGVEPWQRDVLAREEMQIVADPLEAAVDDHIYIYFSKEASSGGRAFGGGGCGCN
jgi:hypothetical protein